MGWLFLAVSLWGAWFTLNVYRPHYRNVYGSVASFFAGWLTGELALFHVAWQVVATAIFWSLGALATPAGQLGIAVTLVSWAGLVAHQLAGMRTADVVEKALRSGLGPNYESDIPSDLRATFETKVGLAAVLRPYRVHDPDVERIRNIRYKRVGGINLELDVYRRRGAPKNCPTLLQIHGGGWVMGTKNEQGLPLMNHLASRGWVCISADYRLSPHGTWPDHLIDLKSVIRWIREEGASYGANPDFLVVTGGSAGGHLAAMVALTANDPAYQPGFESVDTSVSACIPFYGVYDFTNRYGHWPNQGLAEVLETKVMKGSRQEVSALYESASPLSLVDENAPPFLIIHGDRDTLVPVAEARSFAKELREKSKEPVAYAEIPGAQHAFEIFPSLRTKLVLLGAERFAYAMYARYRAKTETAAVPATDDTAGDAVVDGAQEDSPAQLSA
ncbi:MAG: acetyl esterase/lipase [Hyphomicrobiaceae bacterium]|jgi:acetyl esterase/lipase